jgi:uncharacterized heparinase superfamily protein
MLKLWGRLWRTARHLKPVQIYGRLWFRLYQPRPDVAAAPNLRARVLSFREVAHRRPSLTGPGRFVFLNKAGRLKDHGWDDRAMAKLWRYNQHYFDDLNALAAADRKPWHDALIFDWILDNSPGQGSGWEPYPTSLRIINWIKWTLSGNTMTEDAVHSLAVQTRWLARRLEWHLEGNHLFINAKALIFAALYFDGAEAERWLNTGMRILQREIPKQILDDGGQFELSPMYHALAVEDMLDLVNITRTFGRDDLANAWAARVPAMLYWLEAMSHPDGDVAFFNDAALGIAPSNSELLAYSERLSLRESTEIQPLTHLNASGFVRLAVGPAVVIADLARIGPEYLPGHAHADTLSFEISLAERRLVVNSGTSVYGLGAERLRQRGTAAHSTVLIDGQDSSEVWAGFRVGRRAKPFDITVGHRHDALFATAAHDGYRHLSGAPIHRRGWTLDPVQLTVNDQIEGQGRHRIESFLHLAPEITVRESAPGFWLLEDGVGRGIAQVSTDGGDAEVIASSWHPEFGKSVPTQCLKLVADTELPHTIRIKIEWPQL